jgi:hypothetical protein
MLLPSRYKCDKCGKIKTAEATWYSSIELPKGWISWCGEVYTAKHFCEVCKVPCGCEECSIKLRKTMDEEKQCTQRFRASLGHGIIVGGASLGRCQNKCLPGFVVCHEHVTKDALILTVEQLQKEVEYLRSLREKTTNTAG